MLQITAMNDDNSVVTGSGGSPALTMQILEGHGIGGSPVVKAAVGQRITLDIALQNTGEEHLSFPLSLLFGSSVTFWNLYPRCVPLSVFHGVFTC